MAMNDLTCIERARHAKAAADQQQRAFYDALANGLPTRAKHHAEQATRLAAEANRLLSRSRTLIY